MMIKQKQDDKMETLLLGREQRTTTKRTTKREDKISEVVQCAKKLLT